MKSRIYWSMCLVAFLTMVLTTTLFSAVFIRDLQTQMRQQVRGEARYIMAAMEASDKDPLEWLQSVGNQAKTNRITWIAEDGTVRYDSLKKAEEMQNHGERPEVLEAWEKGSGQIVRNSDTLSEEIYYFAIRMNDGTVLRVASTTESVWYSLLKLMPWLSGALIIIFGMTMTLAEVQTKKIIEPINNLNLDQPEMEHIYEELSPLVGRLKHQRSTIDKQLFMMKEEQRKFAAMTEHMSEGLLVIDSRADVISYNTSALRILGVDKQILDHTGMNILNFNRSSTFQIIVNTALKGEPAEKTLVLNERFYQVIANPVAEYREHRGAVVVILDVTEKQRREELRREFTANVSHELKTPLTSISGYAEIMMNGIVKTGDMVRFSENIYQEAQRLITLIDDIINLSRLDEQAEVATIEKEPIDLYQVARDVISRLQSSANKHQVKLSLDGESAMIQGSRNILEEMVYNICDNAIKYNHPNGTVHVLLQKTAGALTVAVKDTGIGIPKHEQERIFERFYRVDKSHSKQSGGTGLGLSIVKYGARYHDAQIKTESEIGKGTTLKLIFPV